MHWRQAFLLLLETLDGVLGPRQLLTESAQIIITTEDVQPGRKSTFCGLLQNFTYLALAGGQSRGNLVD